jgi:hypothetical protein
MTIPPGKGSFEHRLLQFKISKQVEGSIEFKGADVGWIKPNGEKIAIEVELDCNDHILTNIKRDLIDFGFSEVWIVCKNESEREKINYIIDTWLDEDDRKNGQGKAFSRSNLISKGA